jgi:outer membrane lipoprotein-sorting protein
LFASRPTLRWIAPVAVLGVALAVASAGTLLRANAAGALPPRSAHQLLVDLQTARPTAFSGTVVQQAALGLPELPSGPGEGSADLTSLLAGSHTLKVWYDGPRRTRLALLGTLGESDIIRNGRDVWTWSSEEKAATHLRLPASGEEPQEPLDPTQLPATPQDAADQALAALDPTTKVTTDGTDKVAGRNAYQLLLSPRDTRSLIGQVRLAVDAEEHIPLQVQVYARGATEPAFQVGFTRISFGKPSADQFTFDPPPGTKVERRTPGQESDNPPRNKPGQLTPDMGLEPGGDADPRESADFPAVVGKGWTTVVVTRMPPGAQKQTGKQAQKPAPAGELGVILRSLPRVSGSWGQGRLLEGSLFTVLVTDDGRVLAGAVEESRLYSVAASTR